MAVDYAVLPSGLVVRIRRITGNTAVVTPAYKSDEVTVPMASLADCADPHRMTVRQALGFWIVTAVWIASGAGFGLQMHDHGFGVFRSVITAGSVAFLWWGISLRLLNLTHN